MLWKAIGIFYGVTLIPCRYWVCNGYDLFVASERTGSGVSGQVSSAARGDSGVCAGDD